MTATQPLVLAVDDDAGILRLLQLELESQGLRVKTALSGAESIALAAEEKPDVAVVDLRMPQMDGIETMDKLREAASIPVILLTAMSGTAGDPQIIKTFSNVGYKLVALERPQPTE